MNYRKIHDSIIERARYRGDIEGYFEKHHVIPRCLGGSDDKENLVNLTPEEHYLVHQLLIKIYPDNSSLIYAAQMMIPNRPSNKLYGWLRRKYSKAVSENQTGCGNSQYGKYWINDGVRNKKIASFDAIPNGWSKGRISPPNIKKDLSLCKSCLKKEEAIKWFIQLEYSEKSIGQFVKDSDYPFSKVAFIRMLKTHVPEFKTEHGKKYSGVPRIGKGAGC